MTNNISFAKISFDQEGNILPSGMSSMNTTNIQKEINNNAKNFEYLKNLFEAEEKETAQWGGYTGPKEKK